MSKKKDKVFPYHIVMSRRKGSLLWEAETVGDLIPAGAEKRASELARAQFATGAFEEVRHIIAAIESRWGPLDEGGLFNGTHHVEHVAKGSVEDDPSE